ncbi:MAG: hypothetical protein QNK37_30735 [Acidobacteriota bacterium]|nr:hypothetical protein [Acidobacteriota bacterium]
MADFSHGFRAYDISDPSMITPVGDVPMVLDGPTRLTVDGGYAYMLYEHQFSTIDVLGAPDFAAQVLMNAGDGLDIEVAEGYAYVVGENGLHIFDVNDPADPQHVTTIAGWDGQHLALDPITDRLYIASATTGIRVIDITDPAQPEERYLFAGTGLYRNLVLSGDLLVALAQNRALDLLDISNPDRPVFIRHFGNSSDFSSSRRGLTLADDYLLLGSGPFVNHVDVYRIYCNWTSTQTFRQKMPVRPGQTDISELIRSTNEPCPE